MRFLTIATLLIATSYNIHHVCLGEEFDRFDDISTALEEIACCNECNQGRIYSWFGKAKIHEHDTRGHQHLDISFGIDKLRDVQFFITKRANSVSSLNASEWTFGRYRRGTKFYTMDEGSTKSVRLSNVSFERRMHLTGASFDLFAAYDVINQSASGFLSRINTIRKSSTAWLRFSLSVEGNLRTVAFGNNAIQIVDTELVFDMSKGGSVVRMILPNPKTVKEVTLDHINCDGIWIPSKISSRGNSGETKIVEMITESLNRILPEQEVQLERFFPLDIGTELVDERLGKLGIVTSINVPDSSPSHTATSVSISLGTVTSVCLLLVAIVISLALLQRDNSLRFLRGMCRPTLLFPLAACLLIAGYCLIAVPKFYGNKVLNVQDSAEAVSFRTKESRTSNLTVCGHWCLLKVSRALGINRELKQVMSVLPSNARGNSLAELKSAAEQLGMSANGIRKEFNELTDSDLPCIAHLRDPDHFVVVCNAQDGRLAILDGSKRRGNLSETQLKNRWTGKILTLDSKSVDQGSFALDSLYKDMGVISPVGKIPIDFEAVNTSKQPVRIKTIHTDCDCLSVDYPREPIPEGARVPIKLLFAGSSRTDRDGEFEHRAILEMEADGSSKFYRIAIAGVIQREFYTSKQPIDVGVIADGDISELLIPVFFSQEPDKMHLPSVSVDNLDFIDCSWDAKIAHSNDKVVSLSIKARAPKVFELRDFNSVLTLSSSQSNYKWNLPIKGSLVPRIRTFPEVVFPAMNSEHSRSEHNRTVTLISKDRFVAMNDGRFLDVISTEESGFHVTKVTISNDPNTKQVKAFERLRLNVPCKLMSSGIVEEVPVHLCEQ